MLPSASTAALMPRGGCKASPSTVASVGRCRIRWDVAGEGVGVGAGVGSAGRRADGWPRTALAADATTFDCGGLAAVVAALFGSAADTLTFARVGTLRALLGATGPSAVSSAVFHASQLM